MQNIKRDILKCRSSWPATLSLIGPVHLTFRGSALMSCLWKPKQKCHHLKKKRWNSSSTSKLGNYDCKQQWPCLCMLLVRCARPCAWHELGRNGCIELNVHTMSYRKAEIFVFSLPRTEQMHDTYLIAYYKQDGYIYYIKAYLMSYRNIVPNNQYTWLFSAQTCIRYKFLWRWTLFWIFLSFTMLIHAAKSSKVMFCSWTQTKAPK